MQHRSDAQRLLLAGALFAVLFAFSFLPLVRIAAAVTGTFSASATVTNSAPLVYFVDASQSLTGSAGANQNVYVYFNASDANGYTDINTSNATVVIKNGSATLVSANCSLAAGSGQLARFNCTVVLPYYSTAGTWTVNASVRDNSTNYAENTTQTLTVNSLDSISIVSSSISFSGAPGATDVVSSPTPQVVNNTGNLNYTNLNVTAYAFTSGSNIIMVGNVTANTTNSGGNGITLTNNTKVLLASSNLTYGAAATRNIYFYLDIPSTQTSGSYSSQASWIVEAGT